MTSNALLYIEVPDALSSKFKHQDYDTYNSCHLWIFNLKTLTDLLNRCGFEIYSLQLARTLREHYSLMVLGGKK